MQLFWLSALGECSASTNALEALDSCAVLTDHFGSLRCASSISFCEMINGTHLVLGLVLLGCILGDAAVKRPQPGMSYAT